MLINFPKPSISLSMISPGFKYSGGLRCIPTPFGVPVRMTSPGFKVIDLKSKRVNNKNNSI